jgi:hypothetical protein
MKISWSRNWTEIQLGTLVWSAEAPEFSGKGCYELNCIPTPPVQIKDMAKSPFPSKLYLEVGFLKI